MVTVIDYKAGNIRSVCNALERLGADVCLSADRSVIASSDRVILPGVGHAASAMVSLRELGLIETIRNLTQPVLGICIGMQIMCRESQEGNTPGLGIFDCLVNKIETKDLNIPHTGWNTIYNLTSSLFDGIQDDAYVYYVHSYAAALSSSTIATTAYGAGFSGALGVRNFYGTQFHPEKSGEVGEKILANFMKL